MEAEDFGKPAITIEDIKKVPGYENIPDAQALEIIEALQLFSIVAYEHFIKAKTQSHE